MSAHKKQKRIIFFKNGKWTFFFIILKDKCICLICRTTVSTTKKGNLERHFRTPHSKFERRFKDIQKLEPIITFMSFPFSETNSIENISTQISNLFDMDSTKFESEIINIKSDIFLKARGSETNFWNLLSEKKYPCLRNLALQLHTYFGSAYLCKTAFSHKFSIKVDSQR